MRQIGERSSADKPCDGSRRRTINLFSKPPLNGVILWVTASVIGSLRSIKAVFIREIFREVGTTAPILFAIISEQPAIFPREVLEKKHWEEMIAHSPLVITHSSYAFRCR